MAYRESIQNKELKGVLGGSQYFWNVHKNVGYGYRNYKSDVMLVQFLLNASNLADGRPDRKIAVDGQFGGQTWRAIKNFQKDMLFYCEDYSDYRQPVQDGCVSSTNGTKFLSVRQKMPYTILLLNINYQWANSQYFQDIRKDPDLPKFLAEQLTGMPQVA